MPLADGVGGTEAWFNRVVAGAGHAVPFGVERIESLAVLDQQRHLSGGGADRHPPLAHDRLGDGRQRDRFRERGGEAVQPAGAGCQCTSPRLARAQRDLDLFAFADLLVGAGAVGLGLGSGAQRVLVLPGAVECLRGARAQHFEVVAVGVREHAAVREIELHQRRHPAADHQRHDDRRLVRGPARRSREFGVFSGAGARGRDVDRRAASGGVRSRSLLGEQERRPFAVRGVADGAGHVGRLAVVAGQQHDRRIRFERMERLLQCRFDRRGRRARLRQRRRQLRDPVGLEGRALGGNAPQALGAHLPVHPLDQHAEQQPAGEEPDVRERRAGGVKAQQRTRLDDEEIDGEGGEDERQQAGREAAEPHAHRDRQRERRERQVGGLGSDDQDLEPGRSCDRDGGQCVRRHPPERLAARRVVFHRFLPTPSSQ